MILLSKKNAKLIKGEKIGWLTYGLSLAPGRLSGRNLCPHASPGCLAACLFTSGHGAFASVQRGRIFRAVRFNTNREAFLADLSKDIEAAQKQADRLGMRLAIRPNVVSDVQWEKTGIFEKHPDVQFYDYTKNPGRALAHAKGDLPPNYHLTFSRSEINQAQADLVLSAGGNIACVFSDGLPETWQARPVVDGDQNDLRFLDPKGVVVGLKTKGKASKDRTGFVIHWQRSLAIVR